MVQASVVSKRAEYEPLPQKSSNHQLLHSEYFPASINRWRLLLATLASLVLLAAAMFGFQMVSPIILRPTWRQRSTRYDGLSVLVESAKQCQTALHGSECYQRVQWVMREGIIQHPDWYPDLTRTSSFEYVQAALHRKGECHCEDPCPAPVDPAVLVGPWPSAFLMGASQGLPKPTSILDSVAAKLMGTKDPMPVKLNTTLQEATHCNVAVPTDAVAIRIAAEVMQLDPNHTTSPIWSLPQDDLNRCFEALVAKNVVGPEDRQYNRNWCWVGLKEFGCHRHFYDHLSWAQMQHISLLAGVTSSATFHPIRNPQVCDQQVFGSTTKWTESNWDQARRWFAQHVNVFVLSLPASIERRNEMRASLGALRIPFQFVDGVDMRHPNSFEAAKNEGLIPAPFDATRAQAEAYNPRNGMGTAGSIMGTLGCASGHFRAQARGVEKGKAITVVFEDDVSPEADFIPKLWHLVTQDLPCDWQAVSLYSRCPFGICVSPHLTRVQPDVNEPAWRCRHGVNYGFQGMAYRTTEITALQRLWKPVVFDEKRPHCLDVDVALASISDRVRFYAVPASQSPGLLKEISMGSSRVDINFQKQTPVNMQAPAPVATVPAKQSPTFCGNRQGADGCGKDGRATGWCSLTPRNCQKCAGQWCDKSATIVRWVGH
mmetsp:Transcript_127358/g.254418  ORF Transcript_127358/g.254418 Transcript_127358/m.254418 type:complete len:657 (-) Transcript_127358:55-2025(-)